ncbi:replication initiator [Microlunatus sp. Gsoil 973]|uniref:replication initiator n=1 Tax=Microlunatus sp. Gsoil 973 TaxID=2672569 RepID=UPI0012B44211|nr:replication initiator [Microlunatus sp. Gsoil 973]QGN34805.1 replication initiation protein [Microlunatus sp. Gsoil 973]
MTTTGFTDSSASQLDGSGFPGFSEDVPLDLSGITEGSERALLARLIDRTFDDFADTAAAVGYCSHPIRLVGHSDTVDPVTGEILSSFSSAEAPLGVLYRPCGNRRADVCPACSRVYARDTFAMIKAGLTGGKTIPDTVAANPLLFTTLTAPSFGPVHGPRARNGQKIGGRCRPRDKTPLCVHGRPVGCMAIHDDHDPRNGTPLCDDCYQWQSAIIWQWWAPELWRRTTTAIRRAIAARLGLAEHHLRQVVRVEFTKVAEYQARGQVHFHVLIRLDGPDGPGSPAPLDGDQLGACVRNAVTGMIMEAPPVDDHDQARILGWGTELDVKVVRDGNRTDDPDRPLTPEQVAGYLAKYATKDANSIRPVARPPAHLARLEATARDLGRRALRHDPVSPYRLLGKWAHMLGFRGHFSTKSRHYSITLGRLRRARHRYRQLVARAARLGEPVDVSQIEDQLLADDVETTLVIGSWHYQGTGWTNPGDEALAIAAAARAREYGQWKASKINNW